MMKLKSIWKEMRILSRGVVNDLGLQIQGGCYLSPLNPDYILRANQEQRARNP